MISAMRIRYEEQLDYAPDQDEINRAVSLLRMNDKVRVALNLAWLPMNGPWLLDDMFSKPAKLRRYAPWLNEEDIAELTRARGSALTRSDVPLLDEAMELLGDDPKLASLRRREEAAQAEQLRFAQDTLNQNGIGTGLVTSQMLLDQINGSDAEATAQLAGRDREWTYGHIVVDEAQEAIGHFVSQRLEDYWEKGSTSLSVNLPQINLGANRGVARIAHLHANLPGVLAHVNRVLGEENINIAAQSLGTEGELGYVVTDVAQRPSKAALEALRSIEGTIRMRVIS